MSNVAVRVENLGKLYRIGGKQERYRTLRDTLTDAFAAPFRRASSLLRGQAYGAAGLREEIWALKDVSFEVRHGEVVGIIGRNGAGKSTLLKILSRITEPTEGYADVYGRVGSLLEVGTGFHPELTGRENVYLNGAILGMSREEIDRKFDEIVAFAEIERFIDTPVKHYSSGMGLRLGFAVAAHLEPEILVVDEVLAVGDAQFQKKCLGKMSDVAGEGRTVLFVSHNMAAVRNLCEKTALLEGGLLSFLGETSLAIHKYQLGLSDSQSQATSYGVAEFTNVSIGKNGNGTVELDESFEVRCLLNCHADIEMFRLYCIIRDGNGEVVAHLFRRHLEILKRGAHSLRIQFPPLWLRPGVYDLHFKLIPDSLQIGPRRILSEIHILSVLGKEDLQAELCLGKLIPTVQWRIDFHARE
ncbi:MAG: ATP-binding cassette domain-containing protein [Anaerolineae bacterium]|nr:ATP-binding cassette domain-containing protein [Anaerolineae bacterium]